MKNQTRENVTRIVAIIINLVMPGIGTLLVKKWGQGAAQLTLLLLIVVQEELTGLHPFIVALLAAGVLIWSVVTVLSTGASATAKKDNSVDFFMFFLISGAFLAVWVAFMGITMGFVGVSEPLPQQSDTPIFWIFFLVKYHPLLTGGTLIMALLLTRFSRLAAYLVVLLVPAIFACMLFIMWQKVGEPHWAREYENAEQAKFVKAVAKGDIEDVQDFINRGMDPNFHSTNGAGDTPLFVAYKLDKIDTFKYLLKNKADPNYLPEGDPDKNIATFIIKDAEIRKPAYAHLALSKYPLSYLELLFYHGLDPNLAGGVLMEAAIRSKNTKVFYLLLQHGANIQGKEGEYLVSAVRFYNNWEVALYMAKRTRSERALQEAATELSRLDGNLAKRIQEYKQKNHQTMVAELLTEQNDPARQELRKILSKYGYQPPETAVIRDGE